MPNTYMTSDQHYGHINIIVYSNRPYSSIEEMNQALIDNHNAIVKPEDTVYNLGDFSMSNKIVPDILKQLNGNQILITGNHDKCHKCHKNYKNMIKNYIDYGFKEIHAEMKMDLPGIGLVKFNHLPYTDERFGQFKPKPEDEKYLFNGHVHNYWKRKDNMINMGVDVWDYKPVSMDQIISFLIE